MIYQAEFWVAVAFFAFLAVLLYQGVPRMLGTALDARAEAIKKEIEEARKLKQAAEALLADYHKRRREADSEAAAIIDQARREADAIAKETKASLAEMLDRRTRQAEDKIARAESQAMSDVRTAAIEAAIAASERLVGGKLAGAGAGDPLIEASIRDLRSKLG